MPCKGLIQYKILERLLFRSSTHYMVSGRDDMGINFGSNIFLSNALRNADFGIVHLLGIRQTTWYHDVSLDYEIIPNIHIELRYMRREMDFMATENNLSVGLWMNVARFRPVF